MENSILPNNPLELRKALGLVPGTKKKRGRPAKRVVPSPVTEEPSTSDMTAMATDQPETPDENPKQSTFANVITPNSVLSMDWEQTPIGYVESGSPRITEAQWSDLPDDWRERLTLLAEGREEHPFDTIAILAEYYSDSDLADMPLSYCIEFYLLNEMV